MRSGRHGPTGLRAFCAWLARVAVASPPDRLDLDSIYYVVFFCHILTHAVSCVKMWLYDSDIAENFERYKGGECDAAFKNSGNRHAARAV